MKSIRIKTISTYVGYRSSLIFKVLEDVFKFRLRFVPWWERADITIVGPFGSNNWQKLIKTCAFQDDKSLKIYHSFERSRPASPDHYDAIFLTEQPLASAPKEVYFPYWWNYVDWRDEIDLAPVQNPRFGCNYSLNKLMNPIDSDGFRNGVAMISSNLSGVKGLIYGRLHKDIQIDGFGKAFDSTIVNHHTSGFYKKDILESYKFNLALENQIFPGYFTEKIPEAFLSGCIPITAPLVGCEFNPLAIIDIYRYGFDEFVDGYRTGYKFSEFLTQPLLLSRPSLTGFISKIRALIIDKL